MKIFIFGGKFSVYLNRHVFVMTKCLQADNKDSNQTAQMFSKRNQSLRRETLASSSCAEGWPRPSSFPTHHSKTVTMLQLFSVWVSEVSSVMFVLSPFVIIGCLGGLCYTFVVFPVYFHIYSFLLVAFGRTICLLRAYLHTCTSYNHSLPKKLRRRVNKIRWTTHTHITNSTKNIETS